MSLAAAAAHAAMALDAALHLPSHYDGLGSQGEQRQCSRHTLETTGREATLKLRTSVAMSVVERFVSGPIVTVKLVTVCATATLDEQGQKKRGKHGHTSASESGEEDSGDELREHGIGKKSAKGLPEDVVERENAAVTSRHTSRLTTFDVEIFGSSGSTLFHPA